MDEVVNEKRARFKTFKTLIKAGKSDEANIAKAAFTEVKHVACVFGVLSWNLRRKCSVPSIPTTLECLRELSLSDKEKMKAS